MTYFEAHLFGRRVGLCAQLYDQFGTRIGGADRNDGAPGRDHARVVLDIGQLELLDEVVSQVESLRGGFQPSRVCREAWHVGQACHRPRGEYQAIPRDAVAAFLGIAVGHGALCEFHPVHPAAYCSDAFERVGQGHRDKAGIDNAAGDVWQQRRIQHVIDRRNDRDVHGCMLSAKDPAETLTELAGRAGKSGGKSKRSA